MPKRIAFHVVYATSEDSSYPACELNTQGPAARGWRSEGSPPHELLLRLASVASVHRLQLLAHHQLVPCELNTQGPAARGWRSEGSPPHELLLRLASVASVHRLQLLAHHQLVPSSVEVLVSGGLVSEGATTPCGATYTPVGKVALARPSPEGRTRELRSAVLPEPTIARFVKLRLSGPHPPADKDEQVALMAVNVLGEEVSDQTLSLPSPTYMDVTLSPYDDLAFVMYVDEDVADVIRLLDDKKRQAVADERFEYARRLKSASTSLSACGARIGRWRLRKRTAASNDQFELASRLRDRVDRALNALWTDEHIIALTEEHGINPSNDTSMVEDYDFSPHLAPSAPATCEDIASPLPPDPVLLTQPIDDRSKTPEQEYIEIEVANFLEDEPVLQEQREVPEPQKIVEDELRSVTDSPRRSVTPNSANGGKLVRRRNKSAGPRSTYDAYEESPLPTLRHSQTNEHLRDTKDDDSVFSTPSTAQPTRAPHKLNEKEKKLAALPILIFGYPLVEKFFSKNYLDKEEGLARLRSELTSPSENTRTSPNKTARATAILLQRLLKDKVFSVFCQSNELLKLLFKEYMPERVCSAEVGRCLEKLLPELFRACGDPSPRVQSTAQHTILTLADYPHVRSLHVIPQQLSRPPPPALHPRLALARLQMLEQLVLTHGLSNDNNSALSARRVAAAGVAQLGHAAGAVRACAERVLVAVYGRAPRLVRRQLPPDDAVTRRNLVYRHLFQQFDRIDMQKMLQKAPSEETPDMEQSFVDSLEGSVSHSVRSGATTASGFTSLMTSSLGASSYSLKSMASGATLAPSSISGSYSSAASGRTNKSSLKKTPSKKFAAKKDCSIGYNKLRLDSAVSPKHSPKTPTAEKVHFQDSKLEEVTLRRSNRNTEHRHSMIHFDHHTQKPMLKERPSTVYEPLHLFNKATKTENRSLDSLNFTENKPLYYREIESPIVRKPDQYESLQARKFDQYESPRAIKTDFYLHEPSKSKYDAAKAGFEAKVGFSMQNLHLDEVCGNQMEESGYYSPGDTGRRNMLRLGDQSFEFEGGDVSSGGTTPEINYTSCVWCGRRLRSSALEAHYARRCVVLATCSHCSTTVEARALHTHLLEECQSNRGAWKKCQRCGAALRAEEKDYHVNCIPVARDEWKCPYCFMNVLARDLPWQRHLTQCSRNPRTAPNS